MRNALCHGGALYATRCVMGAGLCATRCVTGAGRGRACAQRVVSWQGLLRNALCHGRGSAHNALCHDGGGSARNALCHGGGPVVTRCVNGSWVDLNLCSSEEI